MLNSQYVQRDSYGNIAIEIYLFEGYKEKGKKPDGVINKSELLKQDLDYYEKTEQTAYKYIEVSEYSYDNKNNLILSVTKRSEDGKITDMYVEKNDYLYDEYDNIVQHKKTVYKSKEYFSLNDTSKVETDVVIVNYDNIYENGLLIEVQSEIYTFNEKNPNRSKKLNYEDGVLQSVVYENGKVETYNYEDNKLKSIDYDYDKVSKDSDINVEIYKTVFEYKNDRIDKEKKYFKSGVLVQVIQYNYFDDGRIVKETKSPNDDGFDWSFYDNLYDDDTIYCKINEEVLTPKLIESIGEYIRKNYKNINYIELLRGTKTFKIDIWSFERVNAEMIKRIEKKYNIGINYGIIFW